MYFVCERNPIEDEGPNEQAIEHPEYRLMTDVTKILDGLNEQQCEAVVAPAGPLLITAGAGSGKTTVLTRRIAWLIEASGVSRHRIIAVTFTNKAAREMKARVESLLGVHCAPYQIATFHGFSNRFLRMHHEAAGLPRDFTILDQDDQKSFINRLMVESQLNVKSKSAKDVQAYINKKKERQQRATHGVRDDDNLFDRIFGPIYMLYEQECNTRGLVDFAEILLRTVEVMKRNEIVRNEVHQRYEHVLVDEFQDTNAMQIEWLKLFCGHSNHITAVGDEDQSIYGWRGAVAKNMMDFKLIFPNTKVVRLEQNYRSTQTILSAANAVISRNQDRFEKNLWTDREGGDRIRLLNAHDYREESQFVAKKIKEYRESGMAYCEIAILYRTHAQSRIFENMLATYKIPFRIYGGLRFFSRMEIKHSLAYLRLVVDPDNNQAFERIINQPPRGIGDVARNRIAEIARIHQTSYMQASKLIVQDSAEQKRIRTPLEAFLNLVEELRVECSGQSLSGIIRTVNEHSGLRDHYASKDTDVDKPRVENLDELVNSGENFIRTRMDEAVSAERVSDGVDAIGPFVDSVTLDAGDTYEDETSSVQLMTLHQAKGLEFPVVFLVGMDERLLPHANSINMVGQSRFQVVDGIAEERRLCYVGMTRAQDQLYLTRADFRLVQGVANTCIRSRFLKEIPTEYIQRAELDSDDWHPDAAASGGFLLEEADGLPGKEVRHKIFGEGTVISVNSEHAQMLIRVNFKDVGEKLLVMEQANLEFVGD